ncbi:MAG: ligase-associated DNA damage response exonuclease [Burkholderiaceae bacterium]
MTVATDLVERRPEGLYCAPGDFYIDPWRPVTRAVITHAHADHARAGHAHYLASAQSRWVLRERLGDPSLQTLGWGETLRIGEVMLSLHPAGHVLGAAQVRIAHPRHGVWVVSGDYRVQADPSCAPFEPVRCDTFVTESTFGLPVYRWPSAEGEIERLHRWWSANAAQNLPSRLHAYSLGKAQRVLAALAALGGLPGTLSCHPAVERLNQAYRATGIALPDARALDDLGADERRRTLLIVPPAAADGAYARGLRGARDALASGWMRIRGIRRRRSVDLGLVISDHADWPGLQQAIRATGAGRVIVTHGYEAVMIRWLREQGLEAGRFDTPYRDDGEAGGDDGASSGGDAGGREASGGEASGGEAGGRESGGGGAAAEADE